MAMIKELKYWHKVTVRGENKLLAEIMGVLRLKTEEGGGGWLGKVKEKLFEIGMGFLWERPGLVSHNRFKKMVARRIRDLAFQKQVEQAREKPSLRYFLSKNPGAIMWPKIRRRRRQRPAPSSWEAQGGLPSGAAHDADASPSP